MMINPYAIPGLKSLEEIAADIWGIPVILLYVRTKNRKVVECRQVLFHHYSNTTTLSAVAIGAKYGLDRNTVKFACKTVTDLIETRNEEFTRKYNLFTKSIVTDQLVS